MSALRGILRCTHKDFDEFAAWATYGHIDKASRLYHQLYWFISNRGPHRTGASEYVRERYGEAWRSYLLDQYRELPRHRKGDWHGTHAHHLHMFAELHRLSPVDPREDIDTDRINLTNA